MEENIKILEEFKTKGYSMLLMRYGDRHKTNLKLEKALESLIKGYRELEEKVKVFDKAVKCDKCDCNICEAEKLLLNSIPKSKIEEKIEGLEKEKEETYTRFLASNRNNEKLGTKGKMLEGSIQALQELLENN